LGDAEGELAMNAVREEDIFSEVSEEDK